MNLSNFLQSDRCENPATIVRVEIACLAFLLGMQLAIVSRPNIRSLEALAQRATAGQGRNGVAVDQKWLAQWMTASEPLASIAPEQLRASPLRRS